jgi:hypothetical protein
MPKMTPSLRVLADGRQETSAEPTSKRTAVELLDEGLLSTAVAPKTLAADVSGLDLDGWAGGQSDLPS